MTTRESFEQWLRTRGITPQYTCDEEYSDYGTRLMWEAWQAASPAPVDGWMPVEIDGERCIRHNKMTLIDIKTTDSKVFYGMMAGDVCLALEKPAQFPKRSVFDMSTWSERWFGAVVAYRLHGCKGHV